MIDAASQKFLVDFGYLPEGFDVRAGDPNVLSGAVAYAQSMYGLDQTGKLDELTKRVLLRTPRCGHPDVQQAATTRPRWGKTHLHYTIETYPVGLGMTKEAVRRTIQAACDAVSRVCGLTFEYVDPNKSGPLALIFTTGRGRRAGFDGVSGTLAYAYLPTGTNYMGLLTLRFDLDEPWTDNPSLNGILLFNVACHELLHSLGLSHTNVQQQLMNPIYNRMIAVPQRGYDIEELVARYPITKPQTPAPSPVQPVPSAPPVAGSIERLEVLLRVNGSQVYGPYEINPKQQIMLGPQPFSFN